VALDSAGAAAAGPWIRPTEVAPGLLMGLGWDEALARASAAPTFPCLIDERHAVAELYGLVNVPTAVWIDEEGHIVRPPEPPGSSDAFRQMNLVTREVPPAAAADRRARRQVYVAAVRDWIQNGAASRHVLSPDEVRRRMRGLGEPESLATACFRLGVLLARRGDRAAAAPHLQRAVELRPDSWSFRRQKIVLSDPALTSQLASTPEFWQAVQALGDKFYYTPIDMEGMPPPPSRPQG